MSANESITKAWPVTAKVGAAGLGAFFLTSVVAGAADPGYSHVREAISALAATDSPGAPVMIAGFMAMAAGTIAVGAGIWRRLHAGVAGRIAAALVTVSGLMMVVAGLARQDCSERLPSCVDHGEAPLASTHFWVHQFVSLGLFLLLTVSMFVMARGLRRSDGWSYLARWSKLAGLFCVLSIAELLADPPALDPYAGLYQRIFVLVLFGWPLLVAAAPARFPADAAGGTPSTVDAAERGTPRTPVGTSVFSERALTPAWAGWVEPMRHGHLR
jgi:hypothetical membrane protein